MIALMQYWVCSPGCDYRLRFHSLNRQNNLSLIVASHRERLCAFPLLFFEFSEFIRGCPGALDACAAHPNSMLERQGAMMPREMPRAPIRPKLRTSQAWQALLAEFREQLEQARTGAFIRRQPAQRSKGRMSKIPVQEADQAVPVRRAVEPCNCGTCDKMVAGPDVAMQTRRKRVFEGVPRVISVASFHTREEYASSVDECIRCFVQWAKCLLKPKAGN